MVTRTTTSLFLYLKALFYNIPIYSRRARIFLFPNHLTVPKGSLALHHPLSTIHSGCICAVLLIFSTSVLATSPRLTAITPLGAQRGTELELTFGGERLQDTEEILCFEPGLQVVKLNSITNASVKAQIKIAGDCQ